MSVTSRFMVNLEKDHWTVVKWIFRYLKGTINMTLVYGEDSSDEEPNILGFIDVDYAADIDKRRFSCKICV